MASMGELLFLSFTIIVSGIVSIFLKEFLDMINAKKNKKFKLFLFGIAIVLIIFIILFLGNFVINYGLN